MAKIRLNKMPAALALVAVAALLVGCDLFGSSAPSGGTGSTGASSTPAPGANQPGQLTSENPHADEAMQPISPEGVEMATDTEGGKPLEFRMDGDTKVFELTTKPIRWPILKANGDDVPEDVVVTAFSYNGQVPGPLIRVTEGDKVRVVLKNELPEATTIHWHGLLVPNEMDGVPGMTQDPVEPGETFTYEFVARPAGTYWYHSHFESDVQIMVGLHAPLIVDPAQPEADPPAIDKVLMLEEWRIIDGETFASMPATGMDANFFTINGRAFPSTEEIMVKQGDRVRLRLVGSGQLGHPIHIHGPAFKIVSTDGHPVPEAARLTKDTVWVGPGERYDIEWTATEPGMWMLHCHIPHHTTNDHQEPGGLMLVLNVMP
ncbi:MAG TPA: copper oxidase [Chloroflexia bacterium]|nr:copper oxidase [Chloroflexia bacterium]